MYETKTGTEILEEPDPPELPWLVRDLIHMHESVLLTGLKKHFKSYFCLELARAVCSGEPFLGGFSVPAPVAVLTAQQEIHDRAFYKRVRCALEGLDRTETDRTTFISHQNIRLDATNLPAGILPLSENLQATEPQLIQLDNLSRMYPDGSWFDDNSATHVGALLRALSDGLQRDGAVLLLVHHDTKIAGPHGPTARGSSVYENFVDTIIRLERERSKHHRLTNNLHVTVEQRHGPGLEFDATFDPDTQRLQAKRPARDVVLAVLEGAGGEMQQAALRTASAKRGVGAASFEKLLPQLQDEGAVETIQDKQDSRKNIVRLLITGKS